MPTLPTIAEIQTALEALVRARMCITPKNAYAELGVHFALSRSQLHLPRQDGRSGSLFENRVQWARENLAKLGVIDRSRRGVWCFNVAADITVAELIAVAFDFDRITGCGDEQQSNGGLARE